MQTKELTAFLAPWLEGFLAEHPFVIGAYLAGSCAELGPEDDLASCSDIDVMLVIEGGARPKPGKLPHRGMVIEGTYIPWEQISDPEHALADYHIAHALHLGRILFDRDGRLHALCSAVAAEFSKPERILQRVDGVIRKIEAGLDAFDPAWPLFRRCTSLLFGAGIMAHAVLVAAQKNPTVRMRYRAAHSVLNDRPGAQEFLLDAAGFGAVSPDEARQSVCKMAELFDCMAPLCKTAFPFTSDLQREMRPTAVDDALSLIDSGLHRESLFWTFATFSRLMQQACADAPELYARWEAPFARQMRLVLPDDPNGQLERVRSIRAALPGLRALCKELLHLQAFPSDQAPI